MEVFSSNPVGKKLTTKYEPLSLAALGPRLDRSEGQTF